MSAGVQGGRASISVDTPVTGIAGHPMHVFSLAILRLSRTLRWVGLPFLFMPAIGAAGAPGVPDAFTQARTYAFAACVMQRYPDTPLAVEAGVWASGIIENGDLPFERYAEIAALAAHAPPPGMSRAGIEMKLPGCLALVDSKDFARRVRRLLGGGR